MHVLITTNYFPPETAAAGHLYYGLASDLVQKGHHVTVVTGFPRYRVVVQSKLKPEYGKRLYLWEDENGFRILRLATVPLPLHIPIFRGLDHFFLALVYLLGTLMVKQPDVAFIYSPPVTLGLSGWALRLLRKTPFVFNVQDIFPKYAVDSGVLKNKIIIRFFEKLENFVYRKADAIAVHSEGNRQYLSEHGASAEKIVSISNWSDTEHIKPGPKENQFWREYDLDGHFVVSYAGTLGFAQDVDTVVEAAAHLKEHTDILFLFVGDGPEKPYLQAKAQEYGLANVRFLPVQSYDVYPLVLQASDACLVNLKPTLTTPVVPSKIMNIMASGRPVLANVPLNGDAAHIIRDSKSGFCLEAGDAKGLADAILKLNRNPQLIEEMGVNGRRYAEEHFSRQVCVGQFEQLFESLNKKPS